MMKGLLLDTINQKVQVVDCENSLDAWYRLLNCDMIEMPEIKIGGKYFTIICDEEGLLKSEPIISGVGINIGLVGNLLIFNTDRENCDVTDLTNEDISLIRDNIGVALMADNITMKPQIVLRDLEW